MYIARQIHEAICTHGLIRLQLVEVVETADHRGPRAVPHDRPDCAFGLWLDEGELLAEVSESASFAKVRQLHDDFHQTADAVHLKAANGDVAAARALLKNEFAMRSRSLVLALMKWRDELSSLDLMESAPSVAVGHALEFVDAEAGHRPPARARDGECDFLAHLGLEAGSSSSPRPSP